MSVSLEDDGVYSVKGKKWVGLDTRYQLQEVLGAGAYGYIKSIICIRKAKLISELKLNFDYFS
jgi:hypothetical protein